MRLSLFILFSYYFSLINAWQSTGNAYGFKPLSTNFYFGFATVFVKKGKFRFYKIVENYLLLFSILSILSVLFFEGWGGFSAFTHSY